MVSITVNAMDGSLVLSREMDAAGAVAEVLDAVGAVLDVPPRFISLLHGQRVLARTGTLEEQDLPAKVELACIARSPQEEELSEGAVERAVKEDDACLTRYLLKAGADPQAVLAEAVDCSPQALEVVLRLLGGAAFNERDEYGRTVLHEVAMDGNSVIFDVLLQHADASAVNALDYDSCSALYLAAKFGHRRCCQSILDAGHFSAWDAVSCTGDTAFSRAAESGLMDVCRTLAERVGEGGCGGFNRALRAKGLRSNHWSGSIVEELLSLVPGSEVNWVDDRGQTLLHVGMENRCWGFCRSLLSSAAFTCAAAKDSEGRSALHVAAAALQSRGRGLGPRASATEGEDAETETASKAGSEDVEMEVRTPDDDSDAAGMEFFALLFERSEADVVNARTNTGATILHLALPNLPLMEYIHASGRFSQYNAATDDGSTALHMATRDGHVGVALALLGWPEVSLAENATDHEGRSALHHACRLGSAETVHAILARSDFSIDSLNAVDAYGMHLLHAMCLTEAGSFLLTTLLGLSRFSLADARDARGDTALHVAVSLDKCHAVRTLLSSDRFSAVNAPDGRGLTALSRAVQVGRLSICEALLGCDRYTAVDEGALLLSVRMNRKAICRAILQWPGWRRVDDREAIFRRVRGSVVLPFLQGIFWPLFDSMMATEG